MTTPGSFVHVVAANAKSFDQRAGKIVENIFAGSLNGSLNCCVGVEITLLQREGDMSLWAPYLLDDLCSDFGRLLGVRIKAKVDPNKCIEVSNDVSCLHLHLGCNL